MVIFKGVDVIVKKYKIILIFVFLFIFLFYFLLNYVTDNYDKNLFEEIKKNTDIGDQLVYVNKYKYNFVVMSLDKIFVYNDKYEKIYEDFKENVSDKAFGYDFVYYQGKLLYEKINSSKKYLTYQYYDVYTNLLVDEIKLRR